MALLVFDSVHAGYGKKQVLRGLSFAVEPGQIVALLGGNGAGKSTALKVAAGILRPWAGRVVFRGEDITGMQPHEIKRRGLSYLPQGGRVFKSLTVAENLAVAGSTGRHDDFLFPQLRPLRSRRAGLLSGGERQMLAIQMALSVQAAAILLDEPTAALAESLVASLLSGLKSHAIATHTGLVLVEQNVRYAVGTAHLLHRLADGAMENKPNSI